MDVCAVIVTFERPLLLMECLDAIARQTRAPDRVLVIDNASRDETARIVRDRYPWVELVVLPENVGGAGGFHEGVRLGHDGGADWVWLMDDDTIPEAGALAALMRRTTHVDPLGRPPSLLSSRVVWTDGRLHPMNRPGFERTRLELVVDGAVHRMMPLRATTFVSLLVARRAIDEHGLPLAGYFIWSDDIEYTARILRSGAGYVIPESVVVHKTARAHTAVTSVGARFYFHVRNTIYMLRGPAWTAAEKPSLLFGLLVSVGQYLRVNHFAPRSLPAISRGVRDGLRREIPRPRNAVLDDRTSGPHRT